MNVSITDDSLIVDARGLRCPLPLLRLRQQLRAMQPGQTLWVLATDPGAQRDIPAYLGQAGHTLVQLEDADGELRFLIRVNSSS